MVRKRGDDATVWIGYADFLTTLTILFLVVIAGLAAKIATAKAGVLTGVVVDAKTAKPVGDCLLKFGESRQTRTDSEGRFVFRVDSLRDAVNVGFVAACRGFATYSEIQTVRPADTSDIRVQLNPVTSVTVDVIPGDALFDRNEFALKQEAVITIVELGLRLKANLGVGEVIAVQGHTDDVPFPAGAGKDNWVLSGERAAAAAKVLTDPSLGVGIPECQVAIMGFGASRPIEQVVATDSPADSARKRARNRRIEFRKLQGTDMIGGRCVG